METVTADGSTVPPSRVQAARQRLRAAQSHFAEAAVDMDASTAGRERLLAALSQESLDAKQRRRLSGRLVLADALNEARAEQMRAMPSRPSGGFTDPEADRAYTTLAESRNSLAQVQAREAVVDDAGGDEAQRVRGQRTMLQQQVFTDDVRFRSVQARWAPDPEHVSPQEQTAARAAGFPGRQALAVLSHQRAAVASGSHDARFEGAVAEAGESFRARFMPQEPAAVPQRPGQPRGAGQQPARPAGRRGRRGAITSADARRMLNQIKPGGGEKVTPGKQQGDPLAILPEPVS